LHSGPCKIEPDGTYLGKHVHAVYALEDLRKEQKPIRDLLTEQGDRSLIVVSEDLYLCLGQERRKSCSFIGIFDLESLEESRKVYLVRAEAAN